MAFGTIYTRNVGHKLERIPAPSRHGLEVPKTEVWATYNGMFTMACSVANNLIV